VLGGPGVRCSPPRFALAAAVLAACLGCAAGAHAAVDRSAPLSGAAFSTNAGPLSATVRFAAGGRRIPRGFFGLAMEYNELPVYEKAGVLFGRIASIIRPRDGGPMTLRVGGKSADHTLWQPDPLAADEKAKQKHLPRGVRAIGRTWLSNLGKFVRRQDLRVLIDLNLAVHSTTMETDFATALQKAVPRGRLAGFEIGNEPDEYHFQPPLQRERVATTSRATPLGWWRNYSPADYRRDYTSYARALKGRIGGIPLGAPDIVADEPTWLSAVSGLGRLNPGFLAIHRYAGSTCWSKSSPLYPTIPRMLSEQVTAGLAASVTQAVQFAHSHGMALRLTEVNTVSCGNDAGVAGSFATALWTPDALFEMIKVGVGGVSWELRPKNGNAPFEFSGDGIETRPELYGLAVFADMTRGPSTLLNLTVNASPGMHVKAWGVKSYNTVRVLLDNKGGRAANVALPARPGPAVVRRLVAPSVRSRYGVTFAGMTIGHDGRWHGRQIDHRVPSAGGYYHVSVPAYSIAVVTL
jgi:hypothetical protein